MDASCSCRSQLCCIARLSLMAAMIAGGLTFSGFCIRASSTSLSTGKRIRRPHNVGGEFYVDNRCIDCDTCRWMAPETYIQKDGMAAVYKQPTSEEERVRALQALLSCPTNSIHTEKAPHDIKDVHMTFPIPVDEQDIQGVYHCGYHSVKSFGAASYFIARPEGNILIDSPRYTTSLANNIRKMGGIHFMFLTHRDDVADHEKWSKEFGCTRILHSNEVCPSTAGVEMKLEGSGPWTLGDDITLIYTPGHTEGSVCLLDKRRKVLFTGDHLAMDPLGLGLSILEFVNWFSVPTQLDSVSELLDWDFEWILPGHGRRASFQHVEEKNLALKALIAAHRTT